MAANPGRGQIWLVDWSPGRGSEQLGMRPALVVQTDAANSNPRYPNTIVLGISTKGRPVASHIKVAPTAANGLQEISKERLMRLFGIILEDEVRTVEAALRSVLVL